MGGDRASHGVAAGEESVDREVDVTTGRYFLEARPGTR